MNYGYKYKTIPALLRIIYILLTDEFGTDNNRSVHIAFSSLMKFTSILAVTSLAAMAFATSADDVLNAATEAKSKLDNALGQGRNYEDLYGRVRKDCLSLPSGENQGLDDYFAILDEVIKCLDAYSYIVDDDVDSAIKDLKTEVNDNSARKSASVFDDVATASDKLFISIAKVKPAGEAFKKLNVMEWFKFRWEGTRWYDDFSIRLDNLGKAGLSVSDAAKDAAAKARDAAVACKTYHG